MLFGLLSLLLVSGSGCAVSPLVAFERALEEAGIAQFNHDAPAGVEGRSVVVGVEGSGLQGRGAVVGANLVLTVDHVVRRAGQVLVGTCRNGGWVKARVVQRIAASPEPLVLLELDLDSGWYGTLLGFTGFDVEDSYAQNPGGRATHVATRRGLHPWGPRVGVRLRPGDSGSPVLDGKGRLVGLLTGRRGTSGVFTPLPRSATILLASLSSQELTR